MQFKINGVDLAVAPAEFRPVVSDLDNADTTGRTLDGMSYRDRITTKRHIQLGWNALRWTELSSILQAVKDEYFDFTYPDMMTGNHITKRFYVGDREAAMLNNRPDGIWWEGLRMTFVEQ